MTTDRLPTYTLENGTHLESAPSRNLHRIAFERIFPRLRRDYGHCIASAERRKAALVDGVLGICPEPCSPREKNERGNFPNGIE